MGDCNAVLFFCKEFELPYRLRRIQNSMKKPQTERRSQLCLQQHTEISRAGQEAQEAPEHLRRQHCCGFSGLLLPKDTDRSPFVGILPQNTARGLMELLRVIQTDSE